MIIMEKNEGIQLTFIFDHKHIHYIIFKHLSILSNYVDIIENDLFPFSEAKKRVLQVNTHGFYG